MDSALAIAIILATSINVAGIFVGWRYVRGWLQLLLTPRVVIHRGNAAPGTPQGCRSVPVEDLRRMLGSGALGAFEWHSRYDWFQQRQRDLLRNYGVADTLLTSLFLPSSLALAGSDRAPGVLPTLGALETIRNMNRTSAVERRAASTSADTRTFYVIKTQRTPIAREGRFLALDENEGTLDVIPNVGRPEELVKKAAQFPTIGALLAAIDNNVLQGPGAENSQTLRICKVTETHEPSTRVVAPVTMQSAKTAKLVVRLTGERIRNHELYRQGDRQQYGSLDTAQVFNGLADLQRRAPQTYTNPDREVLAVTLTPGRTRYEEVDVK